MVKNILKRLLSTMLVLLLVATTFFIFDPAAVFTTAEATIEKTNYNPTDNVTFIVPEAIYLYPVYNAYKASTSSSFKYYVNDNSSWGVTTGENTQGNMYFYYKNTSTANISFTWESTPGNALSSSSTITFGNTTAKGPNSGYDVTPSASQAIPITAGNSPSLAAATTGCYIRWKATFTDSVDGLSKSAYAYTYVYKPYPMPVGCALANNNERGTNHYASGIGFMSGVHGNYSNSDAYPTVNTSNGLVTISGGGAGSSDNNASVLIGSYFKSSGIDNTNPGGWVSGNANVSDPTMHNYGYSNSGTNSSEYTYVESLGGYGWVAVDTSRYSNMNQIPMLTVGLLITDDEKSDSGACYFASNRSSFAHTSNFGDYWNNGNGSGEGWFDAAYNEGFVKMGSRGNMNQGEGEGIKFNRHWSKSPTSGENKLTVGYGNHQGDDKAFIVMNFRCYVHTWNKSDLRTAYTNAIKSMARCNETLLKSAKWTEFYNLFKAVSAQLCKIDQTGYSSVSVNGTTYSSASSLANAMTAAATNTSTGYQLQNTTNRDTFTATQKNIKVYDNSGWKYNGTFTDTTLSSWYKGAKLVFSGNSYNGYTYKGYRTTAETQGTVGSASSGTASNVTAGDYTVNHATGNTTAYFYYLRNNYTITYDTDGGTSINAKSYHVESTDTLPAASGKTGYDFSKWKVTTAGGSWTSGSTFNSGTSLSGKYGNVTLTAQWTAKTYTVTLNQQSGSGGTASVTATYNAAMPSATMPTRNGYTFGGYYDGTAGSGTQYYTAAGASARTWNKAAAATLYAKWTTVTYTITIDYAGGALASGQSNPSSYTIESSAITLKNPTKTGYNFTGWTGSNGTTPSTSVTIAKGSTGNKTYTANWSTVSYTITYNLDGGSLASGVTNPTTYTIETNTFTLNNPSKDGYTFSGWTGSNGGTASTSVQVTKGTSGNLNYTANWSANLYTLTFNANGGATKSALNYRPTDTVTLGDTSKTGYTFVNWIVTTAGGSWTANSTWLSTQSVKDKYGTATLKAQWTPTTYTLSYNLDGGSVATANPTSYTIETTTFTLNNPTKTGYTFAGWTGTGLSSATATVTITKGSTGSRSYTATWNVVNYTISYTLNSGSLASGVTNPTSYNVTTAAFTLNNPTRTGYNFKGWTGANGTTAQTSVTVTPGAGTTSGLTNVHQNLSFTANWTAKTYTVTLDQQSGSGGTTSVTATYNAAMPSATMPTRTGYDFKGYYDGSSGSGTQYYTAAGASARTWNKASAATLYAYWTVHSYTITYTMNGGTNNASNPATYKITDSNITLANATKTGYTFTGWTGNGTTTPTKNLVLPAGSSGDKTFTANWSATEYTITYAINPSTLTGVTWGSGSAAANPNKKKYTVETGAFTLTNPQRAGYTFTGWTGSNGTTAQQTVQVSPGTGTTSGLSNVRGNLSFTANFTVQSYTLTFIPNGGTFKAEGGFTANSSNQTKSITYGSTYGASDGSKTWPTIEYTGYTFGGWKNGSTTYTATTTVSVTASHEVTAQWSATKYTISINYAGGSVSTANPTEYYITSSAITLNQPTRAGYTFAGYTGTDLSQATKSVTIPAGSTGDRSYTATWSTVGYTISTTGVNPSGLTGLTWGGTTSTTNPNPTSYNIESDPITLVNPQRTGYTFDGWTGSNGTTKQTTVTIPTGSTGNKTYTANFTALKYTVTLDSALYASASATSGTAATSAGSTSVQATYGSAMPAITAPTLTGYTFEGYFDGKTGTGTKYYNADGSSARSWNKTANNPKLYAKWTINTSTLTVKPNGGTWSGSTNNQSFTQNYNTKKTIEDPTWNGYTFTGWTKSGDGNGTFNSSTKEFTFGSLASKTDVLTAGWSAVKYTITYDYAGGNVSAANPTEYYVTSDAITLNQPTKTGYTFAGYTGTGLNSATKVVTIPTGSTGNREYTATWTANKVNLVFNPNGGYFTDDANGFTTGTSQTGTQSKEVTYNSTYGAADGSGKTWPNVARTGYTFQKWTSDGTNSGTTYASTGTVTITSQTTIKAYWTATSYTITCSVPDGATWPNGTNPGTYTIESAAITLKNPARTGYTFQGWTGSNGSTAQTTVTIAHGSTGNKTYTATWSTVSYRIAYDLDGGSLPGNQTNPDSYTVETATFTLKNPTKTGYTFKGWTGTSLSGATMSVQIALGSTGNRDYTATWQAKTYPVALNMEGGSGGTEQVTATYDAAMPEIELPARDGYDFAGYFTGQNGTGTAYYDAEGTSARNWNIDSTSTTTLYANWTPTGYTITFDPKGGTNVYTNNQLGYNVESTAKLVASTRGGYTFNGWKPSADVGNWLKNTTYAGGNGTTTGYSVQGMYGNVTLEAQWKAEKYTITYDSNNGNTTPAAQTYYITTNLVLASDPGRVGYEFQSWVPQAQVGNWSTTGTYVGNVGTGKWGNVTLVAQWTACTYTLTFELDGGTLTAGGGFTTADHQTKTVTYNSTYGAKFDTNENKSWPNNPTKVGYDFGGWKDDENNTYTSGGTVTITEDTTITAKWTIQSYNVTVNTANSGTAASGYGLASVQSGLTGGKANYNATVTLQYTASAGYRFKNWSSSDVTMNGNSFVMPAKAVTVTANFEPITYSISYNLKEGALPSTKTNPSSYTIETASFTLNNPERTGYTFAGWTGSNSTDTPETTVTIVNSTGNLSYVANWTPNKYSVTLDRQGGTGGTTGVQATFGAAMPTASKPSKNGYDFAGYYKNSDGTGTQYYDENCASAHVWDVAAASTIYAKWTVKTYTIGYTLAGGTVTPADANPTSYKITDADITLVNPQRTGYTFAGWTGTDLETASTSVTIPTGSYGNRSYTATWNTITYTITYDLADGTLGSGVTNPATYTIETATFRLSNPTKGGYTFAGWKGGVVGTTPTTAVTVTIALGSTGNRSYTATYTPKNYTLYFDAAGGEEVEDLPYNPTRTDTLGDTFMEGYDFAGWKVTQVTGEGNWAMNEVYDATKSVKDMYGNAVLTAQWQIKSYTLTVDPNGGTFNSTTDPSNFTQNYNTTKTLGAASRNGYTFEGWQKISGKGTYTANSNPKTGGTFRYGAGAARLQAQWSANTYTLTYNYGVGAGSVTNPGSYTIETATFTLNNPTADGYTFDGWTGTDLGAMTKTVTITKGSTGNRSYAAQWSKNTYTVTLDRQGGTTGSVEVAATYNEAMPSAVMPTRSGYTFKGYYAAPNGSGTQYYTANGASANVWDQAEDSTIYAYWTAETYTLTFFPAGGYFDVDENNNGGGFATGEDKTDYQTKQVTFGSTYGAQDAQGKTWPAKMTYTGHTFSGWKSGDTTFTAGGTVTITGNTNLTAQWTKKTFTVAFNMNGVSASVSPATKTLSYNTSSTYAPTPTKTDSTDAWVFRGWSTSANTTSGTVPGGGSTISAQTVNGWFNDVGEGGTKTVYAIWQKTLKATFKDGRGDDMESTVLIYNGASSGDVSVPAQRNFDGWTKMGWTTGTSNTAAADNTSTTFTIAAADITTANTDVKYYGRYDRTVAVTYDANGGSTTPQPTSVTQQTNGYNINNWTNKTVNLAPAITRSGYTFGGWLIGSTTYAGGASYTITGNVEAEAQWTLNDFTVTIDPNEGLVESIKYYSGGTTDDNIEEAADVAETISLTTVNGTTMTLSLPVRNGYAFAGWMVTATNGGELPADGVITNSSLAESTYVVGAGDVTLTATWEARQYVLRYASSMEDNWEVVGGTYAFDEEVEVADYDVLEREYPGYAFSDWSISVSTEGDTYVAGDTFTLKDYGVVFDELGLDENNNPVVYMTAEWNAADFMIRYDTNGYPASAIKSAGKKSTWRWQDYASGDYLRKGGDAVVALSGAYSDAGFGIGSYYYVSTATDVRFGLGWSFDPNATEPDIEFLSDLTIEDINDDVLAGAVPVDEEANLYEITLYMIWSANYKPLEDSVAAFQRAYMTYPDSGNTTLRNTRYTGAQADKAVYVSEAVSGRLPTAGIADNAYKSGGAEANEIWNNDSSAPDYATYTWVPGIFGNANSWLQHYNDEANDFTSGSVKQVNNRIRAVSSLLITDPTAQFGSIVSQAAEDENGTLALATENMTDAVNDPQNSTLLFGLALKDVDLDHAVTLEEMQSFDYTNPRYPELAYSEGCATEESDGLSYRPDEETVAFLNDKFGTELNEMYPDCEDNGEGGHHSFNSLITMANEIFSTFGFDPEAERTNTDYFMDGSVMGFEVDDDGYVINPDCVYTTESVYKLFDLIYGRQADGTYKSRVDGSINLNNVALYYQVKDIEDNVLLKKPSQYKLNKIVTMMAYGYHSLEMAEADYSEFENLFAEYFDATWGETLRAAGYTSVTKSNYISSFATYFTEESYAMLSRFVSMFFSEPGKLDPAYEKRPAVEQEMINGRPEGEFEGWVRQFKNGNMDESEVENLGDFNYADGSNIPFADRWTYDEENDEWTLDMSDVTLCGLYCDAIDALEPATADYTAVFAMIVNSAQRTVGNETFYMIDPRSTEYNTTTFYPSTANQINTVVDGRKNYDVWREEYADRNAWGSTRENGLPAYDTEWLYRFYTKQSVDNLSRVIKRINWNYNKLNQFDVDEMENGEYKDGTVCRILKDAIDGLTPKKYTVEFWKGFYDPQVDTDPQAQASDYVGNTDFYFSGNLRMPYRFGSTVNYQAVADPYNLKTFNGWNTMKNTLGHHVSTQADLYTVNFVIDQILLEDWAQPASGTPTAVVSTTDGENYTITLYAEWVDNVTLDIDMAGGTATVAADGPQGTATFEATADASNAGNHPTFDYRTTLTFSNMAKEGYQFDRWVFQKGANNTASTMDGNVYTFGYGSLPKTNDKLLAKWIGNQYTVTFHANYAGATQADYTQTFRYDVEQALTANAFTRTGWRFTNWVDANNVAYTDEQVVSNLTTQNNGNVDLYAVWEVADFTLTFKNDFTLPDWYEESLATFTWAAWSGTTAANDDLAKTITSGQLYGKEDAEGKTWPSDPVITYVVTQDFSIKVSFDGWYTQKDSGGTKITATSTVTVTENQDLYPHFNFERTKIEKEELKIDLETINANLYTIESLQALDEKLQEVLAEGHVITEQDLADVAALREALVEVTDEIGAKEGDTTPPVVSMYENKAALQAAIANGTFHGDPEDVEYMLSESTGETSFVYPGKAFYTYYCYTNSENPAIMLNASEVVGESGRVSYPVTFSMDKTGKNSKNQLRTRTGVVGSGWMNYSQDAEGYTERTADYHIGSNAIENPYTGQYSLQYVGRNYDDGSDYSHYMYEEYILLKPTFKIGGGKQYALYTFEVTDDSIGNLAASSAALAGADNTNSATTDLTTTPYEEITPTNTITIFVEYFNTMNGHDGDAGGQVADANGVGTSNGGALEVYNGFHENGYQNNVWVNKDFLYRNAMGAANADFVTPVFKKDNGESYDAIYVANDPVYGQTDVGSFYYLMKSDDPATAMYWNAYDAYIANNPNDNDVYHNARVAGANAALDQMKKDVISDMKDPAVREQMNSTVQQSSVVQNGSYVYWPYSGSTQWSTMFYAPARTRDDSLVYVHIYDRWGNHYTNILQRDLQDTKEGVAAAMGRGQVTVNELGGSGVQGVSITELNTDIPVAISGMTDGQTWNVVNNQFTITGLPQGSNDYRYTMTVTDNAGNEHTENFRAASDGSVTVTVNDETMGGKYADAANAPQIGSQTNEPVNGVSIGNIEESPMTMLAIGEVDPSEIAVDTIPEAQLTGNAADDEETRPDVYTFTVNDVYTVNLFADSARDYNVTLKSTRGGVVKAYVNGTYTPAKAGKVTIPAGSQVQIRVSSNAGYELTSLTMERPDGATTNLIGAYNAEINDDVTIKAVFAETAALLRIRVENGAVSGRQEMHVSPYSRVAVVADAAPEGKVFAYWAQNGADDVPVSYDEIYTFIATSDVDLKAVYADTPTEQVASIVMDAQNASHVTVVNGAYTLSYSGKITVPEGAQIEEFGLVLTNQSAESCTADNFVIGGTVNGVKTAKLVGQTLSEDGQCMINVNNVAAGQTRTGRLYMTVRLADGTTQTIYSNTWSELTTD